MKLLLSAVASLTLLAICAAHLCLISPRQRGTLNEAGLNKPGSSDCILMTSPCGGRAKENAKITWGRDFEVIFQKNLDHWNKQNPGHFEVRLIGNHNMTLARIADSNLPSLHMYSKAGQLPHSITNGDYILQVVYVTNNPNAPAAFYQCADITVSNPPTL